MPGGLPLVALVILDGWGCAPPGPGNAVELADTPVFDRLWAEYPHTTLEASGEAAGLPPGQMGNSEVGHLTIGSGRRLYQDLMRVNQGIADGSFFENPALCAAFERGKRVHLLGLVSHGGVHSHIDHLQALLRFAPEKTWIHAFTDGRDVSPTAGLHDLAELPGDRIATVVGRYWAMDRDQRWDRTQRAYDALVGGRGVASDDVLAAVQASYASGITDEFVEPIVHTGTPRIEHGDSVIFFNFRPDRGRQLSRLLLDGGFDLTTMTRYSEAIDCPVVFGEQQVPDTLAEVLSRAGARQLHVAETEKYAHVTYFFNGGLEEPWEGEQRLLVASPRDVPSYDFKPEMSAVEVTDRFCAEIVDGYRFAVVNFANPDMVGHTGVIPAVVKAVETTDACLGRVVEAVGALGGACLITADHGNAENELTAEGAPQTAHTTNPVPCILTRPGGGLATGGELRDLAPTVLALLGIERPDAMTGKPLVKPL
jgi:2,3-bisphosphoglycerate-independent phosphoglycerate mutase